MHCNHHQGHPGTILPPHILSNWLLTFAVAMREGQYSKGHQVQVQIVEKALRLVSQSLFWTDILTLNAPCPPNTRLTSPFPNS
jgi:hypothetical protein